MCIGKTPKRTETRQPDVPIQAPQRVDQSVLDRRQRTQDNLKQRRSAASKLFSRSNGPLQTASTTSNSLTEV